MKLNVMNVPKDKHPLNFLAGLGNNETPMWIFFSKSAVENLEKNADSKNSNLIRREKDFFGLTWIATEDYPETNITLKEFDLGDFGIYYQTVSINSDDMNFGLPPRVPGKIFLITMD